MLRSHSVQTVLNHIPYWTGYEEPIKNTDTLLESHMKYGSFDQYWGFCSETIELVHSVFFKGFVIGPNPYWYLEWVIDFQNF
jgi:hypothetical protein